MIKVIKLGPRALSFFFILCFSANSETIRIAIFDTGFCPSRLKISPNIIIKPIFDATSSIKDGHCMTSKKTLRTHGHNVLKTLVQGLNPKSKIQIFPIIIFDQYQNQSKKYWNNALNYSKNKNIDYLLLATGHITKEIDKNKLVFKSFVSAVKVGRGIKRSSHVWPQSGNSAMIMIGSFHQFLSEKIFDPTFLYHIKIDYFFPEQKENDSTFRGSSYSVAYAFNRALVICEPYFKKDIKDLKSCLKGQRKKLEFKGPNENYYTY